MGVFSEFNTLRPIQNGRHIADNIFKRFFLIENIWIPIKISLKYVPKGPINNIPALVQIMAWRHSGEKPLSESMLSLVLNELNSDLGFASVTAVLSVCSITQY